MRERQVSKSPQPVGAATAGVARQPAPPFAVLAPPAAATAGSSPFRRVALPVLARAGDQAAKARSVAAQLDAAATVVEGAANKPETTPAALDRVAAIEQAVARDDGIEGMWEVKNRLPRARALLERAHNGSWKYTALTHDRAAVAAAEAEAARLDRDGPNMSDPEMVGQRQIAAAKAALAATESLSGKSSDAEILAAAQQHGIARNAATTVVRSLAAAQTVLNSARAQRPEVIRQAATQVRNAAAALREGVVRGRGPEM